MKRIPLFSLLLAVALLGGLLFGVGLWYREWMEAAILGLALLALLSVQVILVRRHLFGLPAGRTEWAMPAGPREKSAPVSKASPASTGSDIPADAAAAEGAASETSSPPPASRTQSPTEEEPPAEEGGVDIDRTVFSKFRAHLEQMEHSGAGPTAGGTGSRPGSPSSAAGRGASGGQGRDVADQDGEVVARVQLSSQARQRKPAPGRAAKPGTPAPALPPEEEEEGEDLFADLRPAPMVAAPRPPDAPEPSPPQPAEDPKEGSAIGQGGDGASSIAPSTNREAPLPGRVTPTPDPAPNAPPGQPSDPGSPASESPAPGLSSPEPSPPGPPEIAQAGNGPPAELGEEAAALLHLAEEAAASEDWERARAGLENYLAHLADNPQWIHWRGYQLQVRLAVRDGDTNKALQGFEGLLKAGLRPTVASTPQLLNTLLSDAEPAMANGLRVSMLVRILALFRQQRDQRAMDIAYGWIESAQEKVGDDRRLLQYMRNHLEIRKALDDVPGQLELIDQLGNRCFQLGLTEEAQAYYELGLKLRGGEGESPEPEPPEPEPPETEPTG